MQQRMQLQLAMLAKQDDRLHEEVSLACFLQHRQFIFLCHQRQFPSSSRKQLFLLG